jgi:hypothetical protein
MPATTSELVEHLLRREPVFDQPTIIWDEASFDAEIAPDFHEIGASGQVHTRAHIKEVVLGRLSGTQPSSLPGGYTIDDADVRLLVEGLAQVTYVLQAQGRVTRRSTLYRQSADRWQAVFHQGTVVAGMPL